MDQMMVNKDELNRGYGTYQKISTFGEIREEVRKKAINERL